MFEFLRIFKPGAEALQEILAFMVGFQYRLYQKFYYNGDDHGN